MLVRPGLRKLHGLSVIEVETILTDIAQHAIGRAMSPREFVEGVWPS